MHMTSEQRKLIEDKMNWAKVEFEANGGELTPMCFLISPGGIEPVSARCSRAEKHAMYRRLSKIASRRSAEAMLLVSDAWSAKADPQNDETNLPVRYRSNRTEAINAYLIAADGSAIASGCLPYLRSGHQILWGKLEILEPDPAKKVRLHQFMIPRWDIPATFGYGGPN
jgi:hypothetical protein